MSRGHIVMCNVHTTLNTVSYTLHTEHCTLHTEYCTLHTVYCTLTPAHCKLHDTTHPKLLYAMGRIIMRNAPGHQARGAGEHCTLNYTHSILCTTHYTLHTELYTVYYTLYWTLYTAPELCNSHCTLQYSH